MRCIDCESHAIIGGKLDCNYMNRLGLAQPEVKDFITATHETPEQVQSRLADVNKRIKDLQEEEKKIKAQQEQTGVVGEEKSEQGSSKVKGNT